jgi:hypothetical protein
MAVIGAGRCLRARNVPVNNPDRQVGRLGRPLLVAFATGWANLRGLISLIDRDEPIVDTGSRNFRGIPYRLTSLVERAPNSKTEVADALLGVSHCPINFSARALHHTWWPGVLTARCDDREHQPHCIRPTAPILLAETGSRLPISHRPSHQTHEESCTVKRLCAESRHHICERRGCGKKTLSGSHDGCRCDDRE